uniref:Transcriptional regulator n=1 Tax=Steinernema glaseri TaxID=37863 RepID=A0A1I7YK78_9BILA
MGDVQGIDEEEPTLARKWEVVRLRHLLRVPELVGFLDARGYHGESGEDATDLRLDREVLLEVAELVNVAQEVIANDLPLLHVPLLVGHLSTAF